ncbi:MAG: hypothetical protein M1818_008051 [Claussenomyces sp. TS43310]|nr:MAG: hypothetical protein M1818_008051 [Claussenomyces sp. TS43310]
MNLNSAAEVENFSECPPTQAAAASGRKDETQISGLLDWARLNGGVLHARVEVYNDRTYGISFRVRQSSHLTHPRMNGVDEASGGQPTDSLLAEPATLPANTPIVSCPFMLSLSYLNALDAFPTLRSHSPTFPEELLALANTGRAHVVGNFFLVQQYIMGSDSFWSPYVRALPQPDEPGKLGTPLYYKDADREWLRGTPLQNALKERERKWQEDWDMGRMMLDVDDGLRPWKGMWTWDLYKWAATIFTSRGFISHLIPHEVFAESAESANEKYFYNPSPDRPDIIDMNIPGPHWTANNLGCGLIPVLFPLVDLANHDSAAKVAWFSDVKSNPKDLSLIIEANIKEGDQIFNNYAPKGNTELLLGYGFLSEDNDEVPLTFKNLSKELMKIRENQCCFTEVDNVERDSYTFSVRRKPYPRSANDSRLGAFEILEDGCIDTLALLVANQREKVFMAKNSNYCPERDSATSIGGSMSRNTFQVVSVLLEKLQLEHDRVLSSGASLGDPQNHCQQSAKMYRQGQLRVLEYAIVPLGNLLDAALTSHNQCIPLGSGLFNAELVTLEGAYNRLGAENPKAYEAVRKVIVEQLEVDAEIDWAELIESDWAFSLWVFWIYTVMLLSIQYPAVLESSLVDWIAHVMLIYNPDNGPFPSAFQHFQGAADENEIISTMVDQLNHTKDSEEREIFRFPASWSLGPSACGTAFVHPEELVNLASTVAREECFSVAAPTGMWQQLLDEKVEAQPQLAWQERRLDGQLVKMVKVSKRLKQPVLCFPKKHETSQQIE